MDFASLLPCECLFSSFCFEVPSGEFFGSKCVESGLLISNLSCKGLSALLDELFKGGCLCFESLRESFNNGVDIAVRFIVAGWFITEVWRIGEAALSSSTALEFAAIRALECRLSSKDDSSNGWF